MKLIDRHEFANNKAFETYYLDAEDIERHNLPECDVIGFCYDDARHGTQLFAMRPDEALIQARMLVDAVRKVSEGYEVGQPSSDAPKEQAYQVFVEGQRQ